MQELIQYSDNIENITSIEINQIEIIEQILKLQDLIIDFRNIIIILISFLLGYVLIKDFINNIFRW